MKKKKVKTKAKTKKKLNKYAMYLVFVRRNKNDKPDVFGFSTKKAASEIVSLYSACGFEAIQTVGKIEI